MGPPGYFLLTTGYSWPKTTAAQRGLVAALAERGIAGVGLAVPRYVAAFSKAEREAADRAGLPLVEIPFEVPFARVTEELHRAIMAEPYRVIDRADQIHHALMRAASREATLDDLARILCPLIGRSVTFEDPGGKLLAHCSIDDRADAVRRETLEAEQTPPTMLAALEVAGLDRQLRASEKPIRVAAMPEIGLAARVACPIRLGAELVGVVWILEGDEPLSELDHRASEYAALVAAIHVAHNANWRRLKRRSATRRCCRCSNRRAIPLRPRRSACGCSASIPSARIASQSCCCPKRCRSGAKAFSARPGRATRERISQRYGAQRLVSAVLNRVPLLLPDDVALGALLTALDEPR